MPPRSLVRDRASSPADAANRAATGRERARWRPRYAASSPAAQRRKPRREPTERSSRASKEDAPVLEHLAACRSPRRARSPARSRCARRASRPGCIASRSRQRSRMPRDAVAATARLRVDPHLLDLHRARRPRGRLGLEEDRRRPRARARSGPRRSAPRVRQRNASGIARERVDAELELDARRRTPARAGRGRRASPRGARSRPAAGGSVIA